MLHKERLKDVHPDLIYVATFVDLIMPLNVIEGHRPEARQLELFKQGKTKLKHGKHNDLPSRAIDIAPSRFDWKNPNKLTEVYKMYYLAGLMMAVAHDKGIDLRWGGDWDRDQDFGDQTFNDLVHFEIF